MIIERVPSLLTNVKVENETYSHVVATLIYVTVKILHITNYKIRFRTI